MKSFFWFRKTNNISGKMKWIIAFTNIFLSFVSFADTTTIPIQKRVLDIQHWSTTNGTSIYFVQIPNVPMVDLRVIFRAGSAYDGENFGLAGFVNSMIGESTTHYNSDQIANQFDNIGAQIETRADRDKSTVSLRSLSNPKYLQPALSLFTDVISHLNFPDQTVARIKKQTMAAIKSSEEDPTATAEKSFFQTLYSNQPYGHPVAGTLSTIQNITADQLQDFYNRFYVARNMNVVIVGDVTKQQAQQIGEQIAGQFKSGEPAPGLALSPFLSASSSVTVPFPSTQTTVYMGQVAIAPNDPNYFPLIVGNTVYGDPSLASILYKEVRDKYGLAYSVYSLFAPMPARGPFAIKLQTRADQTAQASKVLKDTLQQYLNNGPTDSQLAETKQFLIGSFPLSLASNKDILQIVSDIVFSRKPLDFLDTYRRQIAAVTPEQIKSAFNATIHIDKMATIMVGPKNSPAGKAS